LILTSTCDELYRHLLESAERLDVYKYFHSCRADECN